MGRRVFPSILITFCLATIPFVLLQVENKRVALYDLAFAMPYLIFLVVGFLGEKLNQRRILFTAILIGLSSAYLCFDLPAFLGPHLRGAKGQILSVALPLMLFIAFSYRENGLRGRIAIAWLAAAAVPLLCGHFFYNAPVFTWLFQGRLGHGVLLRHLPNAGVCLALLFAGLAYQTEDRYLKVFRYYLAVSLLPLYFLFERTGMRYRSLQQFQLEVSLSYISAAAVLTYANFFLYWQKVYLDELTGIPNRRALNERLSILRRHYTIAMIDIDHFKRFNDVYGHEQGDSVLRFVAKHFSTPQRGDVYRYGGEELCIIFEDLNTVQATEILEDLRATLASRDFFIRASRKFRGTTSPSDRKTGSPQGAKVQVTVSIGLADPQHPGQKPESVIAAADQALYRAKQTGRNRVVA